jgi:hypothetical protein
MLAAFGILAVSTFALAQTPPADQQPPPASGQQGGQTAPAATQPPQQPPAATQPRGARPQQGAQTGTPKTLTDCRRMARTQNLQGDTLRFYMQGCRREIAVGCRQQGQSQGLQGEALRDSMRSCMGMAARRQPGTAGSGRRNVAPPPDADNDLDED